MPKIKFNELLDNLKLFALSEFKEEYAEYTDKDKFALFLIPIIFNKQGSTCGKFQY